MSRDPVPYDAWNEAIRESYYLLAVASDVAPSLLAYTEAVELLISELRNRGWEFSPIAFDTRKQKISRGCCVLKVYFLLLKQC
jgi:hypothetical protein